MTPKTPSTTIASTTGISLTVRDLAAVANRGVVIMVAEAPTNDTVPSPACAVSVAVAVTISSFADTTAVRAVLRPLALIAPNRWADWPPFIAKDPVTLNLTDTIVAICSGPMPSVGSVTHTGPRPYNSTMLSATQRPIMDSLRTNTPATPTAASTGLASWPPFVVASMQASPRVHTDILIVSRVSEPSSSAAVHLCHSDAVPPPTCVASVAIAATVVELAFASTTRITLPVAPSTAVTR